MLNRGTVLCDKCMNTIVSHIDINKLVNEDAEREQPSVSKQKEPVVLSVTHIRPFVYTSRVEKRVDDSRREKDSGRAGKEREAEVVQIKPVLPQVAILEDERFNRLCNLLEKSMNGLEQVQTNQLNSHILADKIKDLSEDLSVSQRDLKEHQLVIRELCKKNKEMRASLESSRRNTSILESKQKENELLKDQLNTMRNVYHKISKRMDTIKKYLVQYSRTVADDIERAMMNDIVLHKVNKEYRREIDSIYQHQSDIAWKNIAGEFKDVDPDNYFGKLGAYPR